MQVRKNLHAYHVDERMSVRLSQKKIIAKKAVELIEENTVIFLGISTVNLELAKCIYQKNISLTIITNMIDIMQLFRQGEHKVNLIFIGGHFLLASMTSFFVRPSSTSYVVTFPS